MSDIIPGCRERTNFIKIKSKNSETKESGFLAGNPEAYKKFNLKLKKNL